MAATASNEVIMSSEIRLQSATHIPAPVEFRVMQQPAQWNLATRIGFRFAFVYLASYFFPFPLDYLPFVDKWYGKGTESVLQWVGRHILHLSRDLSFVENGSGDTTAAYVQALCFLGLAVVATVAWSVLDRRRANYDKLHQWLRLYIRVALGAVLLSYGAIKVIQAQMPSPGLARLMESYGNSSPMGLLWTFMGASKAYGAFAGSAEMLAGILLFVPACTTLAALIAFGVMSNVFMLNMCYDVPVKLFSFHLLVMAIFLTIPDLRRLAGLFLFRRRVELSGAPALFRRRWLNRGMVVLQLALGLFFAGASLAGAYQTSKIINKTVGVPLYGVWSVDRYEVDGNVVPAEPTAESRWQRVIFDSPHRLMIEPMDGTRLRLMLQLDGKNQKFTLKRLGDEKWKADFTYQNPQPNVVMLSGQMDGHRINMQLRHVDPQKFLLTTRGFHWINEYPLNQ